MKKKYKIVEVSEITITKVISAENEDEALEKFEDKVDKDWGTIGKVAQWNGKSEINIKEEK